MNTHQIRPEVVARNRELEASQMSGTRATQAVHPAPGHRKFVMMHASEADYVAWVVDENRRLEKQNALLRGLLLKATLELKKSNPACAEMLADLTPAHPSHPHPTT